MHVIKYISGFSYPGDTIEIQNEDIKNFDRIWLIPIKIEPKKPEVKPEKAEKPVEQKTTNPKESLVIKTIEKRRSKRTL